MRLHHGLLQQQSLLRPLGHSIEAAPCPGALEPAVLSAALAAAPRPVPSQPAAGATGSALVRGSFASRVSARAARFSNMASLDACYMPPQQQGVL